MGMHLPIGKLLSVLRSAQRLLPENFTSLIITDKDFGADKPAVRALVLETRTLLPYHWAWS